MGVGKVGVGRLPETEDLYKAMKKALGKSAKEPKKSDNLTKYASLLAYDGGSSKTKVY